LFHQSLHFVGRSLILNDYKQICGWFLRQNAESNYFFSRIARFGTPCKRRIMFIRLFAFFFALALDFSSVAFYGGCEEGRLLSLPSDRPSLSISDDGSSTSAPDNDQPVISGPALHDKGVTTARISAIVKSVPANFKGERGFCWNTQGKPTIEDEKTAGGKGGGQFTCQLEGLKKATLYFIRPYVMHEELVIYGEELVFSTNGFRNGVGFPLRYVEGGNFHMGCTVDKAVCYSDENPVHEVEVGSFQITPYEITCTQYCAFINQQAVNPDGTYREKMYIDINDDDCPIRYAGKRFVPKPGKAKYPVTEVSWHGAQAFCEWMGGRLPTEAEWEYAARGGKNGHNYKFSGSAELDEVAWFQDNAGEQSRPVGKKKPNELNLYDMSGNVWEWCYDWYGFDYYGKSPAEDPSGPQSGSARVIRGGAWNMDDWNCRISNRASKAPQITYNYYGFRLLIPAN